MSNLMSLVSFDVNLLALPNLSEAALFFLVWIALGLPILLPLAIALRCCIWSGKDGQLCRNYRDC
jgi:predicted signal transduction protein with EAL and GGDEF domain